ncbi:MAG: sensor histidine kinase, partial [Janthinobacterium lividum]
LALLSDRTRERAVERMRADFVANASHELRTPLASLIGFIETLRGPAADDPDAQHRFLGIMAEQGQRMNRLIDDLLSLSRIELTEHVAPSGLVDLAALTETIGAGLAPLFTARDVTLDSRIEPRLPRIVGDRDQLGQVLQNLLENALKYGRDGGSIHVDARLVARAGIDGIAVGVRDEGDGISALHIPRLTERFYRVNTRRSRAVGGTGLGLAIVKHIVNRHRGHLRIESTEGEGTTVTVWVPAARESPRELEEPARV